MERFHLQYMYSKSTRKVDKHGRTVFEWDSLVRTRSSPCHFICNVSKGRLFVFICRITRSLSGYQVGSLGPGLCRQSRRCHVVTPKITPTGRYIKPTIKTTGRIFKTLTGIQKLLGKVGWSHPKNKISFSVLTIWRVCEHGRVDEFLEWISKKGRETEK